MGYKTRSLIPAPVRLLRYLTGKLAAKQPPDFLKHIHSGYRGNKKLYQEALINRNPSGSLRVLLGKP